MSNSKKRGGSSRRSGPTPAGVWNRGQASGPANPVRIRTKRLDEIDSDKIALAYWLLAKQIVEDGTSEHVTEAEARRVAAELEASREAKSTGEERRHNSQSGSQA